jgi:hypothetical protein
VITHTRRTPAKRCFHSLWSSLGRRGAQGQIVAASAATGRLGAEGRGLHPGQQTQRGGVGIDCEHFGSGHSGHGEAFGNGTTGVAHADDRKLGRRRTPLWRPEPMRSRAGGGVGLSGSGFMRVEGTRKNSATEQTAQSGLDVEVRAGPRSCNRIASVADESDGGCEFRIGEDVGRVPTRVGVGVGRPGVGTPDPTSASIPRVRAPPPQSTTPAWARPKASDLARSRQRVRGFPRGAWT